MTTVAKMVERIRSQLYTSMQPRLNALDAAIAPTTLQFAFEWTTDYLRIVAPGDFLAIDDEILYVWAVDQATKQAKVQRGMFGSEPAPHADGALVEISPRFSRWIVKQELRAELQSWPRGLYAVDEVDLKISAGTLAMDLNLGPLQDRFITILQVLALQQADSRHMWAPMDYRLEPNAPTTSFPSGTALFIQPKMGMNPQGGTAHIVVALEFVLDDFNDTIDIQSHMGIPVQMEDIAVYGAMARLLSGTEIPRTDAFAQGEARVASEVPATFRMTTANQLKMWRDERIAQEVTRLIEQYGIKM